MIITTLIIDILLLLVSAIWLISPHLEGVPFLVLVFTLLIIGIMYCILFIASLFYLVKMPKVGFLKAVFPLLFNIFIIAIVILIIPFIAQMREQTIFSRDLQNYQNAVSLFNNNALSVIPNSQITYPNKVSASIYILPPHLKYLSVLNKVIVYQWEKTTVIFFARQGAMGRYGGYCYTSVDEMPNQSYQAKSSNELSLNLQGKSKILPHWYACAAFNS